MVLNRKAPLLVPGVDSFSNTIIYGVKNICEKRLFYREKTGDSKNASIQATLLSQKLLFELEN